MRITGGEQVRQAVTDAVTVLGTATERDWGATRAGSLEWSCRETAAHIASDLIAYAGNLAGRAQDAYVPFQINVDGSDDGLDPADNAGLLHVIETTGALFTATLDTTPRATRAFHPYPFRSANREGFAAMGIAEVLLHTHDMAEGLGLPPYQPPADLCAFVLTRIFPHVRPGPDHWTTLLWATGRADLPGRPRLTEWRWSNNLVLPAERLTLEGVTPAVAADLAAGGDGGFDWLAGGPIDGTREGAGLLLKQYEAGTHRPEWGMYVLVRPDDDRALGAMGFHGVPDADGRVEIGYDLTEPARGHGYATEALRTLAAWALSREEVEIVFATVERENTKSQAVLERAGFTRVSAADDDGGLYAYELRASRYR
ncbi:GNAT family N-acetyltransferase [Streptomyces sp. NPDC057877]|uniref:GNAT family N-acetyltransferase n=1 Tax=Streptomyces sp. NPDC057877 TaxID=3346269 RepID=UPI0036AEF1FD